MAFPYPPDPGEHVLKRSSISTGKQDFTLNGHQGPPNAPDPNLKRYKYNVIVELETGEKTYKLPSALAADALVTYDTNAKEHDLLSIQGCRRLVNLSKRDKHDLSSLASPKGEMKSSFSWTNLCKSPTSCTLCFGEPILRKLNQVRLLCNTLSNTLCDPTLGKLHQETKSCITKHIPLCDSAAHTGTPFSVSRSPSETNRVSDFNSSLVTIPSSRRILDKPKIENTSCWQKWGAFQWGEFHI